MSGFYLQSYKSLHEARCHVHELRNASPNILVMHSQTSVAGPNFYQNEGHDYYFDNVMQLHEL
jgi:hypothetical protein